MAHLPIPGWNKNGNNRVNSFLVQNIIKNIVCCVNNILIVNNIGYLALLDRRSPKILEIDGKILLPSFWQAELYSRDYDLGMELN